MADRRIPPFDDIGVCYAETLKIVQAVFRLQLQKGLHLSDDRSFAVQKPLGEGADGQIWLSVLVGVLKACDHAPGVGLDHHAGDLGIGAAVAQTKPGGYI